mmetsp:Transcript_19511/g.58523  ORF Transcript_19511/g.58523 Transcript_19511/m.58523 type:complete len:356 (+) Transcript_19511:96-1163(+)
MMGCPRWVALCAATWLACLQVAGAQRFGERFIFASSPSTQNVVWARLPSFKEQAEGAVAQKVDVLIDGQASKCTHTFCTEVSDQGLKNPQGLAVVQHDVGLATLYVSDPEAQNIYAYKLALVTAKGFSSSYPTATEQVKVREGVVAQWLTADGYGNLFYTSQGKVEMISAANLTKSIAEPGLPATPTVLYTAANSKAVAGPAGIATDNFFLYWANQQGDSGTGSVARGPQRQLAAKDHPPAPLSLMTDQYQAVATNVCLARDNVFFTGESSALFAIKSNGGAIAEVNANFTKPTGCVYDDESTLYVADEGANAIFSLPANFANLRTIGQVSKFTDVNAPSQLAVYAAWTQMTQKR